MSDEFIPPPRIAESGSTESRLSLLNGYLSNIVQVLRSGTPFVRPKAISQIETEASVSYTQAELQEVIDKVNELSAEISKGA